MKDCIHNSAEFGTYDNVTGVCWVCGKTKAAPRPRITKADIGKTFTFHGYDGKTYRAELIDWRRKIATIRYIIWPALSSSPSVRTYANLVGSTGGVEIKAYISDLSRLDREVLI